MHNIWIITKRELRALFDSPVAYIVVVGFLAISGWMYFSSFFLIGRADLRGFFAPSPFSPSMLLVILAPAITMRLIAEERKSGTIELLSTLPITDTEIIIGKFLASMGLLMSAFAVTFVYAIAVALVGDLDWGPVIAGYIGLILFSSSLLALGLLMSTITEDQIVAFMVSFMLCAALYFVFWLSFFMPQSLAEIVEYISVSYHLDNIAKGVVDSRDVLYYVTLTGGALFLSVLSLKRQHA